MTDLRGRSLPSFSLDPDEVTLLTDPGQKGYDPRVTYPLDEEMVQSIMRHGVIIPIVVKRDGNRILPVDGRQRVLHAREANKRLIDQGLQPVRIQAVFRQGEDQRLFLASLAANTFRRQDRVYVMALKAAQALNYGSTADEVAKELRVTTATVENYLKLLQLHPKILNLVKANKLSYTVAMRLAKLPRDQQVPKFRELVKAGTTNANAVRVVIGGKLERVPPPNRQQLRRVADAVDARAFVLAGTQSQVGDAYAVLAWVLGRVSTEEALDILPAGPVAEAIKKGMRIK